MASMSTPSTFTLTSPTEQQQHTQMSPIPNHRNKLSMYEQPQSFLLTSSISPSLNSINQIYNSTKEFITEIDNRISKSNHKKQMNQMKSSEKYHHMVKSFQAEITRLKKRLKLEESITNPTKEYINDMLNQLITLRRENEGLKKQLDESKHSIELLRTIIDEKKKSRIESPSKDNFNKSRVEKLPNILVGASDLKDNLDKYLSEKSLININESKFDKFLKDVKKYQNSLDLTKLLNEIERWVDNQSTPLKSIPQTIRLRYHANHISPIKKSSRKKINSVQCRGDSIDFEHFRMPPQEAVYLTKKLIKKRELK